MQRTSVTRLYKDTPEQESPKRRAHNNRKSQSPDTLFSRMKRETSPLA